MWGIDAILLHAVNFARYQLQHRYGWPLKCGLRPKKVLALCTESFRVIDANHCIDVFDGVIIQHHEMHISAMGSVFPTRILVRVANTLIIVQIMRIRR